MDLFQLAIVIILIICGLVLCMYVFYMSLKMIDQREENEPILTNLMVYEPPAPSDSEFLVSIN